MSGDSKPRPKSAFYWINPGPAAYRLPPLLGRDKHAVTHPIRPEYTFRPRLESVKLTPGPGVGKYGIDQGLKANGKYTGPEFSLRPRLDKNKTSGFAGPGAHDLPPLDLYRPASPAFTFRKRTPYFDRNKSPGPSAYILPTLLGPRVVNKSAQEEVTMKGRPGLKFDRKLIGPGPGAYSPIPPDLIKSKAPEFSLGTGARYKKKWVQLCGPGSYDPTIKIYPEHPAYSFGIRHNDFTASMYTECDKAHMVPNASPPSITK